MVLGRFARAGTASLGRCVKPSAALVGQHQVNEADGHRLAVFRKKIQHKQN